LENFAKTMGVPTTEIAERAFRSRHPAELGSRCTVFMNSRIITEQKNGKEVDDILAGLCRSIIENVFTKVIRISSLDSLGDRIVVQGGTFCNDAVLRAIEQYTEREVVRAPYPGLMGAIGAAHAAMEAMQESSQASAFIGFDALRSFTFRQINGLVCQGCENHCRRSVVTFSTGDTWITGNRCERGGVLAPGELEAFLAAHAEEDTDPVSSAAAETGDDQAKETADDQTQEAAADQKKAAAADQPVVQAKDTAADQPTDTKKKKVPARKVKKGMDLFKVRKSFLTRDYPCKELDGKKGVTIGLPFVLF
jgi:hypothetical protein